MGAGQYITTSFEDLTKRLEAAIAWAESLGIAPRPTRFGQYLRSLQHLVGGLRSELPDPLVGGGEAMKGVWDLNSPADLLQKLRCDLDRINRMKNEPHDRFAPFDFFIAAYHMLEWLHPDTQQDAKIKRAALRAKEPLLQIARHLANGSKHFETTGWNKVAGTPLSANDNAMEAFSGEGRLTIKLSPDEAKRFGVKELDMQETAKKMYDFWRSELERQRGKTP